MLVESRATREALPQHELARRVHTFEDFEGDAARFGLGLRDDFAQAVAQLLFTACGRGNEGGDLDGFRIGR